MKRINYYTVVIKIDINYLNSDSVNKYYLLWSFNEKKVLNVAMDISFTTLTFNEAINKVNEINILNPNLILGFKLDVND
jgi:hypothetical protein